MPSFANRKKSVDSLIEHIGNADRIEFEVYYNWFAWQTMTLKVLQNSFLFAVTLEGFVKADYCRHSQFKVPQK